MSRWAIPGLVLVGCQGDSIREIPEWQDGVLVQGDCPEEVAAVDQVGLTTSVHRGVLPLAYSDPLEDPVGRVVTDEATYNQLMTDLYFGSWPILDFNRDQVGFVWYRADSTCGLEFQEIHINTKQGGGTVLEVTLLDTSLNCAESCAGQEGQYLVIQAFPKDEPGSVCRRVVPGCPP